MNRLFTPSIPTVAREKPQQDDTRLYGTQLIVARMACIAAGLLSFVVFVASVPATYEAILSQFCTGTLCNHPSQASVQFVQQLQVLGLSVPAYAIYLIVLNSIFVCTYFIVAIIFLWRRFDDWMALFASFFLMTFALNFTSNTMVAPPYWVYQFVIFLGAASIVVFFYLFPTGRFVPRWTRWLSIGAILFWGLKYFLPSFPFNPYNNILFVIIGFLATVGAIIIAQVYRYLRISNSVQRQQTKWVVFGVSIAIGGYIVFGLIFTIFFPSVSQSPLADILFNTTNYLLLLLIPISLAFAILRSRLWDIDIIINRTLVYGILTASVVAIYVLVVGSLGAVFQARSNLFISLLAAGLAGRGNAGTRCGAAHDCRNSGSSAQVTLCGHYHETRGELHHCSRLQRIWEVRGDASASAAPPAGLPDRTGRRTGACSTCSWRDLHVCRPTTPGGPGPSDRRGRACHSPHGRPATRDGGFAALTGAPGDRTRRRAPPLAPRPA